MDQPQGSPPPAGPPGERPISPPPLGAPSPQSLESDKDARNLGMLSHLLGVFSWFVGSLLIWLLKKQSHPFVEDQAREALNFQITMALAYVVVGILAAISHGWLGLLFPILYVANLAFCLMGAMRASKGVYYRYPVVLRLVQ